MKKQITLLMISTLLVMTMACGRSSSFSTELSTDSASQTENAKGESVNGIVEYQNKGYTSFENAMSVESDENGSVLTIYLNSPDYSDAVLVEAALTEEEYNKYEEISSSEDEDKLQSFIEEIADDEITVTSLKDQIPSKDDLSQYVGKSLADLEADDYSMSTDEEDEDGNLVLIYVNCDKHLILGVSVEGDYPDFFSMCDEDPSSVKISNVFFHGFQV